MFNVRTRQLAAALLAILPVSIAIPDTVKLTNREPFKNVSVRGFRSGHLLFRGVSGETLRKPLTEVEWVEWSNYPSLTAAERASASRNWTTASNRYESALDRVRESWQRNLIHTRLLRVYDHAGLFDRAVTLMVRLGHDAPRSVLEQMHLKPGPPGSEKNERARKTLLDALSGESPPTAIRLRTLLLELYLYDEVRPLPPVIFEVPDTGRTDEPDLPAPAAEIGAIGILPADDLDEEEEVVESTSRSTSPIRIGPDSCVRDTIHTSLESGQIARAFRIQERAWPYVSSRGRYAWRLTRSRCWIAVGRVAEAAADLVDLAESDPDRTRAAEALYYVGLAHERMNRPDVARRSYADVLDRPSASTKSKTRARAALERLQK